MTCDLLIVGGGINGCAIAREAALHGASVLLVERDDLAAHTSSASTKLIHGGLRYLEYYDFKLVREALKERERLLRLAPHLVRGVRFVLPHVHAPRPAWMVRLGLWLYDAIGGRSSLPRARSLKADDGAYLAPLATGPKGFVYSDAMVDDAALTRAFAADAVASGAEVRTGTELISARRGADGWTATLSDGSEVRARILVNATGPWAGGLRGRLGVAGRARLRLVKGSHIVVPRLYEGDHAYLLQQPDRRVVFAIPWRGDTAIGTTDVPVERPDAARIDAEEVDYLCAAANRYFRRRIAPADVIGGWSGVRPLYDDGAGEAKAVTRDYVLELDEDGPPLLSVFGGKITTARRLAEDALAKLGWPTPVSRDRPLP
ncbi:glycerol-3-phosphate dehydrogenase [Sphingomonas sp. DT-204]|uniref:glycerol-3-phosphate dehydrogenase n=1 Tax=Sphingomonas sp. DT-204 TaxID=3396166 RepID=UPI003F1A06E5